MNNDKFLDFTSQEEMEITDIEEVDTADIDSPKWMKALPDEYRETIREEYKTWLTQKIDSDIALDEVESVIMVDLNFLLTVELSRQYVIGYIPILVYLSFFPHEI